MFVFYIYITLQGLAYVVCNWLYRYVYAKDGKDINEYMRVCVVKNVQERKIK